MKSIKPGRGPSMMSGIGSILVGVFGVIWTIAAASMGAPWFFCLFGVAFVVVAIVQALYNLHNATGKNRFSSFDITDSCEEGDPLQQRFGGTPEDRHEGFSADDDEPKLGGGAAAGFCPYCGAPAESGYAYCRRCGKRLP